MSTRKTMSTRKKAKARKANRAPELPVVIVSAPRVSAPELTRQGRPILGDSPTIPRRPSCQCAAWPCAGTHAPGACSGLAAPDDIDDVCAACRARFAAGRAPEIAVYRLAGGWWADRGGRRSRSLEGALGTVPREWWSRVVVVVVDRRPVHGPRDDAGAAMRDRWEPRSTPTAAVVSDPPEHQAELDRLRQAARDGGREVNR